MKTNRRGFLGKMLAGAAAIVGAGLVAPSVVKAEASETELLPQAMAEALAKTGYFEDKVIIGSRASVDGATIRAAKGVHLAPLTEHAALTNNFINYTGPTFEAMQADPDRRAVPFLWHAQWTADAYERGRAIEAARVESRVALGLPLGRETGG